jgi:hypothetical protein
MMVVVGLLVGAGPASAAESSCPSGSSAYTGGIGATAHYRLGEQPGGGAIPDGTVARDNNGFHRDGIYHGNVAGGLEGALLCDPDNFAVSFDGDGSAPGYISLGTLRTVGDFTVEGWTFSTAATAGPSNPSGNQTLFGDYGSERLLIRPRGAYGDIVIGGVKYSVSVQTPSNIGAWVYWAFERSGGTLAIYRNGVRIGATSGVPTTSIPLRGDIGRQANGSYPFRGGLDEIALYPNALPPAQVEETYGSAIQGPSSYNCGPLFSNPYYGTIIRANPRNHYRLGEQRLGGAISEGTVARDEQGNDDGTYHGDVAGRMEGALTCDPNNLAATFDRNGPVPGRISLGTLTSVHDFTIEGFSYLTDPGDAAPSPDGRNATLFGDHGSERLLIRPRGVYGDVMVGGVQYSVQATTGNNTFLWHHWALVRSGGTLAIYRDGKKLRGVAGVPTSSIPLRGDIGRQANGSYPFQGGIDEIALYTRALSPAEVAGHYQASLATLAPPDEAG